MNQCLQKEENLTIILTLRWVTTGSQDAFNNMITDARCEGANNKCKVQTIIQDNGCLLFYHALAKRGSKQVAECPSEDWPLIV